MPHTRRRYRIGEVEALARSVRLKLGIDDQHQPNILLALERLADHGFIASYTAVPDQKMPHAEAKFSSGQKRLYLRESVFSALTKGDARARWTVAHELGHAVLGHPRTHHRSAAGKVSARQNHDIEKEAHLFAAAFLVPFHLMERLPGITEKEIATSFGISRAAAEVRLRELKEIAVASAKQRNDPSRSQSQSGEALYERLRESLERSHFGSYVMIHLETREYVVDRTMSAVHEKFIAKFGEDAPGWCTRIGISAFATA